MYESEFEFIGFGFISNDGNFIKLHNGVNHTELAEEIISKDEWLKKEMNKRKYATAIDFLIYEMGYVKVGNRKQKEIVCSAAKKHSKDVEDDIMILECVGYRLNRI